MQAPPTTIAPGNVLSTALALESRSRADAPLLWFLRLPGAGMTGAAAWGLAVAAAVAALFALELLFEHGFEQSGAVAITAEIMATAGFFMLSLGFLIAIARIVFPAAVGDLQDLRPHAECPPEVFDAVARALVRLPRRESLISVLPALLIGGAHVWLLREQRPLGDTLLATDVATLALWVAMFQIGTPLVQNARLFSLLGANMRVDLYHPENLTPFGRTAIRPCLLIVALQCAYAVLILPEGGRMTGAMLIGLAASTALIASLFFLPLRGVTRRIRATRDAAVAGLDRALRHHHDRHPPGAPTTDPAELLRAGGLLEFRARLKGISSWPIGLAGVRQILIYLVLVPMTWVGAALVEMTLDGRL